MVVEIGEANSRFSLSLERARADLESLDRASAVTPALAPYAARFREVVQEHERLVDEHEAMASSRGGGPFGYRRASSLLGAIVTEQDAVTNAYAAVVAGAAASVGLSMDDRPGSAAVYQQTPPFYERIRYSIVRPPLDAVLRAAL